MRDQRRLAAIVSADVAGYSRLMGRDESGTHAHLKAHLRELINPKIAEYGGRIVKTTGDGLLLEYASVVDAVRCAVDVQRGMAERNSGIAADQRIEFRVGINVGDIIIDADDIFGDGVNVAARLQSLADPGGICVSSAVRDHVLDKLSFAFDDLGPTEMKNIVRPVHAYRVNLGRQATRKWGMRRRFRDKRWWLAGAVAATAVVAIAVIVLRGGPDSLRLASFAGSGANQPPALSIAILSFTVAGVDESLAQRLTQDVTTRLAHKPYMFIAAYGSVSSYKGKAVDAGAVGRDLNVRYVAEGDIRQDGDKVVVALRMMDVATSRQLSSDRLETTSRQLDTNFEAVSESLANRILSFLFDSEMRRASQQSGTKTDSMVLWLRGLSVDDGTQNGARDALKLYDEALRHDPKFAPALAMRAITSGAVVGLEPPGPNRDRLVREMEEYSLRAVAADGRDSLAWAARAQALVFQARWDDALEALDKLLRIDPNKSLGYYLRGQILVAMGRPQDTLTELDKAVAIDARLTDHSGALRTRCIAHLLLGHYEDAIKHCERAAVLTVTDDGSTSTLLTAAYAQKGDTAKAVAAKAQLLRMHPDYTIARLEMLMQSGDPSFRQRYNEHVIAGLRKAGLAER